MFLNWARSMLAGEAWQHHPTQRRVKIGRTVFLTLAAPLLSITLSACALLSENASPQPAIELYAMDCGRGRIADGAQTYGPGIFSGQARDFVDPCYLIRHPRGDLIWDTGFPEAIARTPGAGVTIGRTLTEQLAQLSLSPSDIEFLSMSHSHIDHVGNATLFSNAMWIVDAEERAYMFRPEARSSGQFRLYAALENFPTRLIEGDEDYDLFGDGTVVILQAPGHTPGHTILRLRLRQAGTVVLAGDLYQFAEAQAQRLVPIANTDRAQTLSSMDKVERIIREANARVVRQHVPEDFETLPRFPQALD